MPRRFTAGLLAFGLCGLGSLSGLGSLAHGSPEAPDEWELRKSAKGIEIHTRPVSGSRHREFKASTEVAATVANVMAVLQDTSACPRWLHRCVSSRVLTEPSPGERTFYQVNGLPFPAKSRDAIFRSTVSFDGNGVAMIEMRAEPGALPETNHVRVPQAHGTYLLEPLGETSTRITWTQFIDPGGALPAWVVNRFLTEMPFKSLVALRELARSSPYSNAVFNLDKNGAPVSLRQLN